MINFTGVSHVNIIVEDIEQASQYYERLFGAIPRQELPHFKNIGFAKSAGFLQAPEKVDVCIRFLEIVGAKLYIELMEYHTPRKLTRIVQKETHELGGPRHIALKVTNIEEAFTYLKEQPDVWMINESDTYQPFQIDAITPNEVRFFDPTLEGSLAEKQKVCEIISHIKYFYFIDKYGVQWELEQGHHDIGT